MFPLCPTIFQTWPQYISHFALQRVTSADMVGVNIIWEGIKVFNRDGLSCTSSVFSSKTYPFEDQSAQAMPCFSLLRWPRVAIESDNSNSKLDSKSENSKLKVGFFSEHFKLKLTKCKIHLQNT